MAPQASLRVCFAAVTSSNPAKRCRALGLCLALGLVAVQTAPAHAQATPAPTNPVTADFKGMIGLGLIGAELGFAIPAVAGARDAWVYIVFPIAGAGGGAAAGYFLLEKGAGEPELAVAALATGMALLIPTMVLTLSATAYDPEKDEVRAPPSDVNVGGSVKLSSRQRHRARARDAGPGLLRVSEEAIYVGAPAVSAGPTLDSREALRIGAAPDHELAVSVVSGRF